MFSGIFSFSFLYFIFIMIIFLFYYLECIYLHSKILDFIVKLFKPTMMQDQEHFQ